MKYEVKNSAQILLDQGIVILLLLGGLMYNYVDLFFIRSAMDKTTRFFHLKGAIEKELSGLRRHQIVVYIKQLHNLLSVSTPSFSFLISICSPSSPIKRNLKKAKPSNFNTQHKPRQASKFVNISTRLRPNPQAK